MAKRMIEKIPFLHRATAYNIMIEDDISFDDLHALLDEIGARGGFDLDDDLAEMFEVEIGGRRYCAAVDGLDVMIVIR